MKLTPIAEMHSYIERLELACGFLRAMMDFPESRIMIGVMPDRPAGNADPTVDDFDDCGACEDGEECDGCNGPVAERMLNPDRPMYAEIRQVLVESYRSEAASLRDWLEQRGVDTRAAVGPVVLDSPKLS